jgi:hypothetical protein
MLRNMKDLLGFSIGATDGIIGTVKDMYFDDAAWVIRYVVVETARVAIEPASVDFADGGQRAPLANKGTAGVSHEEPSEE